MKIYGRTLISRGDKEISLDGIDEIVIENDHGEDITISLYSVRVGNPLEVRASNLLVVHPRAANVIRVENKRWGPK